jgi:hypothetical protein
VATPSIFGGILGTVKPSPGIAGVSGNPIYRTKIAVEAFCVHYSSSKILSIGSHFSPGRAPGKAF